MSRHGEDRRLVERRERPQVEHRRADAVRLEALGDFQRGVDVGAVADDRQVIAGTAQRRTTDRQRRGCGVAETLLDARVAVERDVLVVEHRVGIGHGARHQRAGVRGRRRHHDLEPRRPIEPALGILAVIGTGVPQAAPRHAHDHRHLSSPSIADLRGVVHELIESRRDEVVELHLADRPLTGERRADADANHRALGDRRIDDAVAEFRQERPEQEKGVAVGAADVFAEHEDAQRRRAAHRQPPA